MEKGVRTLELDFSVWGCVPPMYTFPHYLLKHLCDDHIPIQGPCACIGLKSLKVLNFNCVNVAGEVLEYFLSNCTVLEQLLVCESPSLIDLRVVGSSVALKYLLVQDCSNIKSIEIYDAKLISFIYKGEHMNLLLRNVPLLVEVSICMPSHKDRIEVAFAQLSCCLSHLKILKLNHIGSFQRNRVQHYKKDLVFPVLASLKHLELCFYTEDDSILVQLTSFINASPNLQGLLFALEPPFSSRRDIKYKATKCSHQHLRVVQLVAYDVGYGASTYHLEVVKYLIESAVELEKILITPNTDDEEKMDRVKKEIEEEEKKQKARNHSRNQLVERVPLTIAFVKYNKYCETKSKFACLY